MEDGLIFVDHAGRVFESRGHIIASQLRIASKYPPVDRIGLPEKPRQDHVTPYFTKFASGPRYGMNVMRPPRLFLLLGSQCFRIHSVRLGSIRDGDEQRQTPATRHRQIAPDFEAAGLGRGDGLRPWLVLEDCHAVWKTNSRGRQRRLLMGGMEHGIVVAVTSSPLPTRSHSR